MLGYGAIGPVFFLYMIAQGLSTTKTGALLTCVLVGDLFITLYLTTRADRLLGRRNVMITGALLQILAGVVFALTNNFTALVIAGIFGVISTSGGECGPFIAVEQVA